MSVETETGQIALGGRSFTVSAFTFDQLQRILPAFGRLRECLTQGGLTAAREIISAALEGQVAVEELAALRTSLPEILAAVPVIAKVSGLIAVGEALAAEPQTGESPTGTLFTPSLSP